MGSLILQVGQCGNQVGMKLWNELRSMHSSKTDFLFRDGETIAHSVMIDTEPKVLRSIKVDRTTYSYYDPNNILFYQSGRGNNWAMGYSNTRTVKKKAGDFGDIDKFKNLPTLEKAQLLYKTKTNLKNKTNTDKEFESDEIALKENTTLLDQTIHLIQKEIEKIDYYTSTMMISSLAGGTGSGFGSRIMETMRDEYTSNLLYNTVVFPSASGENPLQQYNCLLSLSHLQDFSDGIIYFQNDKVFKCLSRIGVGDNTKPINIDDINEYVASLLANLLKVNDLKTPKRFYSDYLSDLTCLPECKFIEMYGSPFTMRGNSTLGPEATWESVIDQTFLQTSIDSEPSEGKQSAQQLLTDSSSTMLKCIMRSPDIDSSFLKSESVKKYLDKRIQTSLHPVKWNPDAVSYELIKEKIKHVGDVKSMLILANRAYVAGLMQEVLDISRSKYKAKAYLHWYYKYGLEEEDFTKAFENIEMIIDNYTYMKDQ